MRKVIKVNSYVDSHQLAKFSAIASKISLTEFYENAILEYAKILARNNSMIKQYLLENKNNIGGYK